MLDPQKFVETIAGQRRGWLASSVRLLLGSLTPVYRLVIAFRNRGYDRATNELKMNGHSRRVTAVKVPVISVGNLTTGGTGKTPMVIWISRLLRRQNFRVVIISRGYGAGQGPETEHRSRNDEAMEMELRLPDVPHLQDADRVRMANIAIDELESEVILLDDGFQHRRLHRDLDIVLIDATNPFGYDRLLPRGLLREPLSSLKRADIVVLTRCDRVTATRRNEICLRIKQHQAQALIAQARTSAKCWLQSDGQRQALNFLDGKQVFAFCGIGNPGGFQLTLDQFRFDLTGLRIFPDHHQFSRDDLEGLARAAAELGAEAMVCTHKDLVKIACNRIGGIPVFAILIDLEFSIGQAELEAIIHQTVVRHAEKSAGS